MIDNTDNEKIGVELPAYKIPNGSTVNRGRYKYVLSKKLMIYSRIKIQTIKQEGMVYIINSINPSNITEIPSDTILIWNTTENEYYEHLTNKKRRELMVNDTKIGNK